MNRFLHRLSAADDSRVLKKHFRSTIFFNKSFFMDNLYLTCIFYFCLIFLNMAGEYIKLPKILLSHLYRYPMSLFFTSNQLKDVYHISLNTELWLCAENNDGRKTPHSKLMGTFTSHPYHKQFNRISIKRKYLWDFKLCYDSIGLRWNLVVIKKTKGKNCNATSLYVKSPKF